MGIMLIFLAIAVVLLGIGFTLTIKCSNVEISGFGVILIVIGAIITACDIFFFMLTLVDVIHKDVTIQSYMNNKATLSRLLKEDYNGDNLTNALQFNQKQKMYAYKEHTFMWSHFNTEGVYVDTLAIPTDKFTPKQIINLNTDSSSKK